MDSSMADACLRVFGSNIEEGRKNGAFGPEIPVALDASTQEKLLGLTGRTLGNP